IIFLCLTGNKTVLKWICLLAAGITILASAAVNLWQWQHPGSFFTISAGRASAWEGDANVCAEVFVTMMGLFLALSPSVWLSGIVAAAAGIGLFCTLSRSGEIIFLLTLLVYGSFLGRRQL